MSRICPSSADLVCVPSSSPSVADSVMTNPAPTAESSASPSNGASQRFVPSRSKPCSFESLVTSVRLRESKPALSMSAATVSPERRSIRVRCPPSLPMSAWESPTASHGVSRASAAVNPRSAAGRVHSRCPSRSSPMSSSPLARTKWLSRRARTRGESSSSTASSAPLAGSRAVRGPPAPMKSSGGPAKTRPLPSSGPGTSTGPHSFSPVARSKPEAVVSKASLPADCWSMSTATGPFSESLTRKPEHTRGRLADHRIVPAESTARNSRSESASCIERNTPSASCAATSHPGSTTSGPPSAPGPSAARSSASRVAAGECTGR